MKLLKKILVFIFLISNVFGIYYIPSTFGIYKETKILTTSLNITKPVYTITLDSDNAEISGSTTIYVKGGVGFFLDLNTNNQMTTSTNSINVPEKDDYEFQGYYTEQNGEGIEYIDKYGNLTNNADENHFTSDDTLYAYYIEEPNYAYNVVRRNYKNGYGQLYSDAHQDSMDASKSIKRVYYYYGDSTTEINEIKDMYNVIFAGQCWQMYRTTDTGGVRMIYNGEAVNDQCLSTRGTHVGYVKSELQTLSNEYYYGTDYTYDSTNKVFELSGNKEKTTWNESTGPNLIGKYTCKSSSETATCSTLYLVESYYDNTSGYVISLNSSSKYSNIGKLQFNVNDNSIAYVGYMYNKVYPIKNQKRTFKESMLSTASFSTSHWYSHSVEWGNPTEDKYNLVNSYKVSSSSEYPNLIREYTFAKSSQTYTDTKVRYITSVVDDSSKYYYIELSDNEQLSDVNYTYTYSDNYIDNLDGTFTLIDSPVTISRSDWYSNYTNLNNKYICKNAENNTCSELWYATATSDTALTYTPVYKFASNFTYSNGKYTLDSTTSLNIADFSPSANLANIKGRRYTCFNGNGICNNLSYVYYTDNVDADYFELSNGNSIADAIEQMLSTDNVNQTNSTIKSGIDAWYKKYLYSFDNYIDDTVYCQDRTIKTLNTFDANNTSSTAAAIYFNQQGSLTTLTCQNITDRFSISNSKARLTYKVALVPMSEYFLLNNSLKASSEPYWALAPSIFNTSGANNRGYLSSGGPNSYTIVSSTNYTVRPVISLKKEVQFLSGDGSMATPYIVDYNL